MSKKQQHSAFPILQDWRIRGGNAECRRGGGREPASDAGTKNKERGRGDGAGDDIVLKKKKALIAHQCAMHKRYLVRGDSPEEWTDAALRKRG